MRKTLLAIALVLVLLAAYFIYQNRPIKLITPNGILQCELASTAAEREAGLSNRESLCPDCCMLFKFEAPGKHGFWMKDMRFAIDIVFLDESAKVVDLWQNAQPCTPQECPVYYPRVDAKYVVEVNAGQAATLGLAQVGQVAGIEN